jgi:hypothetical protein
MARSSRARELALHAKDVAAQTKQAKNDIVREALLQVETNLQRADERRAHALGVKASKAAAESKKVQEVHQARSPQKIAREEHAQRQQVIAEERRMAALEAKTSKAAVESTKIRIVREARSAERAAMEEHVISQQVKAQERRRESLGTKTYKAAAANAKVEEVLAAKCAREELHLRTLEEDQIKQSKAATLREAQLKLKRAKLAEEQEKVIATCNRVHAVRVIQAAWRKQHFRAQH